MRVAPTIWIIAIAMALAAGGAGAAGVASTPAGATAAAAKDTFDSTLIRRQPADVSAADPATDADRPHGMEWPRVAAALAVVVGIILLLRYGGQRLFNTPSSQGSTRAVQVLSRSILAPRQHILLVQVGKRVLVVGDSGAQMSSLCEITDADEVASLIGQIRSEKTAAIARPFGSLFGRARQEMPADEEDQATPPPDERHVDDLDEDDEMALAATRHELSGLAEKIRLVSRQMKNG